MLPKPEPLRLYGRAAEIEPLSWSWVATQLESAGTYWVSGRSSGHPHPRPVWGVWLDGMLAVSVGSPALGRQLATDPTVTVHLDSGTDVVIIEGRVTPIADAYSARGIAAYDVKYDWSYTVEEYGPLTGIAPTAVFAWRSAGWAGREGFRQGGSWTFS